MRCSGNYDRARQVHDRDGAMPLRAEALHGGLLIAVVREQDADPGHVQQLLISGLALTIAWSLHS